MKLETVIGIIMLLALFVGAGLYYRGAPEKGDSTPSGLPLATTTTVLNSSQKAKKYSLAPELANPSGFINTGGKPITLGELRGKKVVLLDVWTYSCINCQRTLPYVTAWYKKYAGEGLEIVGLHTPEFSFEHIKKNVEDAVARFGITYPVVLDNDYSTWNAYGNQYWPRKYLIDIDGYIVYDHTGEGNYAETERAIQTALAERKERLAATTTVSADITVPQNAASFDSSVVGSPEVYFGSARNEYLSNGLSATANRQTLALPANPELNRLYLGGTWQFMPEYAENQSEARIVFRYQARNVYMVASSATGVVMEVLQDGKLVGAGSGADVDRGSGTVTIKEERLYTLIEDGRAGEHTLELRIKKSGFKVFTFTFG